MANFPLYVHGYSTHTVVSMIYMGMVAAPCVTCVTTMVIILYVSGDRYRLFAAIDYAGWVDSTDGSIFQWTC